ncbi:protein RALF-like 24 [Primulina huaijiensis]|uniref:protein RALF-like 24 n=1 Tax=Primulina huaijiensis TaxID=1492673 RepID=UPI003CC769DB
MPHSQLPRTFCYILLSVLLLPCFFHNHVGICEGVSVSDLNSAKLSDSSEMAKRVCAEKIGEMAGLEEEMDSESNRRALLMQRRYISYDTLMRDLVPCNKPGASYYNCRDPGMANFYNRGCEVITRCARGG